MLAISLLLLVLLLILFIFFTAIGLTFKLKILGLEEKEEYRGAFTVKWLLLSHTFSVEEPGERESFLEESQELKKDRTVKEEQEEISPDETEQILVTSETKGKIGVKEEIKTEEKGPEEKRIKISEKKEKRSIISRLRGKKKPITTETQETGMTAREKLHWGLKAYQSLRQPLLRLFSDLLNGIKIKRLESYITFGLSDPADTGMLCGVMHSVAGLAYSRCRHCSFSINPVFMNPMIDFRGNLEIRVRIYSLVLPMLKFMFNRKTLSFTYSIIKEKLWGKWKFHS